MVLRNSGQFARGHGRLALPRSSRAPEVGLVSVLIAGAALTLAACGGASGGSSGAAGLAANMTGATATGTTAAGTARPASGWPATSASVPNIGSSTPTAGGSTPGTSIGSPASGSTPTPSGAGATSSAPTATGGAQSTGGSAPTAPSGPQTSSGGSPLPLPTAAQALTCPLPGAPSGQVNSAGSGQAIPAGFQPVVAVQCVPNGPTPSSGGEPADTRKEVAVSGLGPLLAALLEPSAAPSGSSPAPRCLAPAAPVFQLALIDASGNVIEPLIPVTVCGGPIEPVVASMAALDWTVVS